MANNCQVPTPRKYVIEMLNYVKYKKNLFGKRVLENSCGQGNILLEIVKRYIVDARKNCLCNEQIIKGLENDIVAFEIDKKAIDICIHRLNALVEKMGLSKVNWNINNKDFLRLSSDKYDYIIGNPPYITYHDLEKGKREFLKKNFDSCKQGRFDYSYAFIEASINALKEKGKLIYLIPYSVAKNKFANQLRQIMTPYITAIYDYAGIKIFPNAITSSIIVIMENKNNKKYIQYYDKFEGIKRKILREKLVGKWNFVDQSGSGTERFGDHFEVCNSVATLYNRAFVIRQYTEQTKYYCVNGMKIEKQIVYPAISMKTFNNQKKENEEKTLILFPYKVFGENIEHYKPGEFEAKYPLCSQYLKSYWDKLEKRKKDKNALWFEYGRSQAIGKVFGEKIVMPMVVTNSVSVCKADKKAIPYAGYFVKCNKNTKMTLDDAKKILESKEFFEYVKIFGTPTTPTSYRISVNDIREYRF